MTKVLIECPQLCGRKKELEIEGKYKIGDEILTEKCDEDKVPFVITKFLDEDKSSKERLIKLAVCNQCKKNMLRNFNVSIRDFIDQFSFYKICKVCNNTKTPWVILVESYAICFECYNEENTNKELIVLNSAIKDNSFIKDCKHCKKRTSWQLAENVYGAICSKCFNKKSSIKVPINSLRKKNVDGMTIKEFMYPCSTCNQKTLWATALHLNGLCSFCKTKKENILIDQSLIDEKSKIFKNFQDSCSKCNKDLFMISKKVDAICTNCRKNAQNKVLVPISIINERNRFSANCGICNNTRTVWQIVNEY